MKTKYDGVLISCENQPSFQVYDEYLNQVVFIDLLIYYIWIPNLRRFPQTIVNHTLIKELSEMLKEINRCPWYLRFIHTMFFLNADWKQHTCCIYLQNIM